MNKIQQDKMGEAARKKAITDWCVRNSIPTDAQVELFDIIFGKNTLAKDNQHG